MEQVNISPKGFEKQSAKLTAEHLDRPVDEVVAVPPVESVPEEVVKEEPKVEEPPKEPEPEEEKVPKSRFLTMHQRAVEAEKRLLQIEADRANEPVEPKPIEDDEALKNFYITTFGDTPQTEALYKNELARLASIEEKAADRAFERLSQREQREEELINQRVSSFDSAFEELAIQTGKTEFTDDEQVALLDIVENYSPKDKDGRLIGDFLLPLDKAYEIYQIKQETATQPKKAERNKVASLIGAKTEGTPIASSDAEWRPGETGRWRNKLPN